MITSKLGPRMQASPLALSASREQSSVIKDALTKRDVAPYNSYFADKYAKVSVQFI